MRILIAGGGISGLSLAYWLQALGGGDMDVTVLEAEHRPGGKIWTDRAGGFLCESGVNGFLDNKPRTLELAGALGLQPVRGSESAKKRYIYWDGRLHPLPESPKSFIGSSLISPGGKLRIALEAFLPGGGSDEETLAEFARRRLGREALMKLIDPMASGIFAGDPEQMSLAACFPRIRELERSHGSLIRGMFKLMAERKKKVSAGPGGSLASFGEGMQAIVDALVAALGPGVRLGARAVAVEPAAKGGYRVALADGSDIVADKVVLAVPAYSAADILDGFIPDLAGALREIKYPPLSVVCTGFDESALRGLRAVDGFGFLVPFGAGRKVLGTLFDSNIYAGRAPGGKVLLRTMVGGARAPSLAVLEDAKLTSTVMSEIRDITGIVAEPELVKIYRHERAIPQYDRAHPERLLKMSELLGGHAGLYVTGNAMRGIGVNDCIENSRAMAERILKYKV